MFKNPIDQFIHEIGGTVKVARIVNAPASTVSSWRTRGIIPPWRAGPLIEMALRAGIAPPAEIARRAA